MTQERETFQFQAEAQQLLDLMVHSIYTNKDIFLRELISNSSDALDRRRFEAVSHPEYLPEGTELEIVIDRDEEKRTLAVRDNGIGMTRDETINLIGTIAKSGTNEFRQLLQQAKQSDSGTELIGQFGVGFYATFMVADRVTVLTRHVAEDTGTRWESTGDGSFTVEDAEIDEPGTTVLLELKPADPEDGLHDYASEWKIREIVKKYSDFVAYPIKMEVERTETEHDEEGKPKEGAEPKKVTRVETLNSMKAIWLRDKDEVTEDEYREFYKHISHDWSDPLETIRAKIEGTLLYQLLLFIPSQRPFDLFMREGHKGVQLYVKRVFIMDDCKELVPEYLRFIRGVVDSDDLSLNISRETLQQNRQIQRMRKGLTGKVLDTLRDLAGSDGDKYLTFWQAFGEVLKEGLYQDTDNRDRLLDLLLFESTKDGEALTSLPDYVDRMPEGQEHIFYMTGESRGAIENSPHLEAFREKGYEVLLLTDRVDEVWTQSVFEYKGKTLKSVGKGAVELGTEEERKKAEEERKEKQQAHASLMECLKDKLDDYVKEVRLSNRLTDSAACLVTGQNDMTPQLEAMLKAANQDVPQVKRILELNPDHAILESLQAIYDSDSSDPRIDDYARLLYGQALLAEGGQPPEPARFAKLVTGLMMKAL